jgi:hypothetical protein
VQVNPCIEFGLLIVMILGPAAVIWSRVRSRAEEDKSPRGIGVRVIQLISLLVFAPLVGLLSLEGKLGGETVSALIGVAIGYTLSGVEKAVPGSKK